MITLKILAVIVFIGLVLAGTGYLMHRAKKDAFLSSTKSQLQLPPDAETELS